MTMAWLYLAISTVFEVGWLIALKHTQGFTKLVPILFYAFFGAGSAFFLSLAMKKIPMVAAYGGWVGGTMVWTALIEIFYLKKPYGFANAFFLALIVCGVAGTKVLTTHQN